MPDITIWSWMQSVLKLSATELMIFAYLFTKTFDNVHRCYTALDTMADWFGMTRQAISRHITKMCDRGFINRVQFQDKANPIIKHNSYAVCISYVTELCENSDSDTYKNFLDSYRHILQQKFPNDIRTVDEYIRSLEIWHSTKDMQVSVTIGELAQLISNDTEDDSIRLTDLLAMIRKNASERYAGTPYEFIAESANDTKKKAPKKKKGAFDIIADAKKKTRRTSTKAKKEEWNEAKREITSEFITMRVNGNTELMNLLNAFLDTANGNSLSPQQWQIQLDELYALAVTPERMIEGVKRSFMNNYKSVYIADKSENDIAKKLKRIKEYVDENADGSEELYKLLESYILETQHGKSCTDNMFAMALENLSELCPTTQQKIDSVRVSYTNGYKALAYTKRTQGGNYNNNNNAQSNPIDIVEKKQSVDSFIKNGYYHLVDGLRDALYTYVETTTVGQNMPLNMFNILLNNLRLFCFDDREKVNKVRTAIQNNSAKFAYESFEETRMLQARNETRESMAKSLDRSRKQRVEVFKKSNPNDERVSDVIIEKREVRYV